VFALTWAQGRESVFLVDGSYLAGALVLLALHVVASACHEVGHALATKRAGRRVGRAGVLLHFGLPAVFVDTSDAWMAGRRARMRVTAAGPMAGLFLAGLLQLAGLVVPGLAPLAFKLAFLWYLQVLLSFNPLLPLDGYHLLLDWLEVPNLRGRAASWIVARLRRRPPAFGALDREGRLVALYGVLAVLWLAVAANVAYRVWTDRVVGFGTGLWHDGTAGRLLVLTVVGALAAPLFAAVAAAAVRAWRRLRGRLVERHREADAPRRLAVLRASEFGRLPTPALTSLANRSRWVRPRRGEQLVVAGRAQSAVYVVAEGALEGRRPGDPGGAVRHRVGPGGVVGLAHALTGRPAELDWYTAGTTLLALPPAVVTTVVGPVPGPPPADRAQAEALFDDTPALTGLGADDRLGLIASAHAVDLEPGAPISLPGPSHAVIVESGVIAMPDGTELRRGTLIGPVGEGSPGVVALARTAVRVWVLPDASHLPPLAGGHAIGAESAVAVGAPARFGIHPANGSAPLAVPPAPPNPRQRPGVDERLERRLWWLVAGAGSLAVLLTGANVLVPGPAWAEMRDDRALLTVQRGSVTLDGSGAPVELAAGSRRHVGRDDRIAVAADGTGLLVLPGGASLTLCAGTQIGLVSLGAAGGAARADVSLDAGRLLADTGPGSGAFAAAELRVRRTAGEVRSAGPARFAADPAGVSVATGTVSVEGGPAPADAAAPSCGNVAPAEAPTGSPTRPATESPSPSVSASGTPSVSPSASTSATPGPEPSPPAAPAPGRPSARPERTSAPRSPAQPGNPTSPTPPPPSPPPVSPPPPSPAEPSPPPPASPTVGVPPPVSASGVVPSGSVRVEPVSPPASL
jgi:putative peptide zinc metalloprotease protein